LNPRLLGRKRQFEQVHGEFAQAFANGDDQADLLPSELRVMIFEALDIYGVAYRGANEFGRLAYGQGNELRIP
jgi:hypothetical protein